MDRMTRNRLTGRENEGIQAGGKMDNRKKNEKKRRSLPTQMNLMTHIVAGAYLIYLAYSIYSGAEAVGSEKIVMLLAAVLFGVIGAVIIFSALRSLTKGEYVGGAGDLDGGNKEEEIIEERRIRFDGEEETSEENADRN